LGSANQQELTGSADAPRRRPLGWLSLLALGINGIVGVGIFFAPREVAAAVPGWSALWVYVGVAVMLLPTGLVFARLGRAFPVDGGPYVYARAAFGPRTAFAVGWITYVSALFSTAAVLAGLVDGADQIVGASSTAERLIVELVLLTVLMGALSRGLRLSAIVWSAVTALKLLPLVALPLAAVFAYLASGAAVQPHHSSVEPRALLTAALPVLFALQGFEVVPLPAAQVARPQTSVPLATVGSLVLAAGLYVALHASCLEALPDLGDRTLPLADAAAVYGGYAFRSLVIGTTSLSAFGIVVGMLAMTPRYLAPLGRQDSLGFGLDLQSAGAVPRRAFAVTYALLFVMLCASALWGSVGHLLALSSLSVTLQYGATSVSLWALASKGEAGLSPRDRWPVPLALVGSGLFLLGASALEIPILGAMLSVGFGARALGKRKRSNDHVGTDLTRSP
jgi:basic amino acid/polyamine antiporter, APA family